MGGLFPPEWYTQGSDGFIMLWKDVFRGKVQMVTFEIWQTSYWICNFLQEMGAQSFLSVIMR